MEINELRLEEGAIQYLGLNSESLVIEVKRWNQEFLKITINSYVKFIEYDSIGREISEFLILENSEFLKKEKEELVKLDFDENECNQLVHLKFVGLSELPLLDVIADKNEIHVIRMEIQSTPLS
ncbi:hypothetical protein ABEW19_10785 [Paenibacillus illinoisensis]|uniref:hypothetical protein n=1 Tax=Paenibacillus illinoisensis TaxID=59845 RepID=UPI003D2B359F